jgi:hypothetical protein
VQIAQIRAVRLQPQRRAHACADAVLERYDGARVRFHIMTLAHRQTRECLRKETCEVLANREGS